MLANGQRPASYLDANITPYEQSWSFGVERELPGNVVIDAEYIGKKGTHLPFSGSNQLDILGPQIESYTPDRSMLFSILRRITHSRRKMAGRSATPTAPSLRAQVQGFQLQLPYPQFTGVANDVR